jgi:hypothetical protein
MLETMNHASSLGAALAIALVGCGGAPSKTSPASNGASNEDLADGVNGGANAKEQVTADACSQWGDKLATLMKAASVLDFRKCMKMSGKSPDKKTEAAANKAMDKKVDEIVKDVVDQCAKQAGKKYIAGDATCYMNAPKLEDWADCQFKTPFFQDFATMARDFDKSFLDGCTKSASDHDDDDD